MLEIGGKIEWPGILEVHVTERALSQRQIKEAEDYSRKASHCVVVMQLGKQDEVLKYYYNGAWVTPRTRLEYLEAVSAIIRHKKLSIAVPEFFTMIVKQGGG